jgi:hypothetical protein
MQSLAKLKTTRVSQAEPDLQVLSEFQADSIRKHAITFVPEKAQRVHKNNVKFPKLVSFLNIVNEFDRIIQREKDGLQAIDWDEAREETKELYACLVRLHGPSKCPHCGESLG